CGPGQVRASGISTCSKQSYGLITIVAARRRIDSDLTSGTPQQHPRVFQNVPRRQAGQPCHESLAATLSQKFLRTPANEIRKPLPVCRVQQEGGGIFDAAVSLEMRSALRAIVRR